MPKSEWVEWDAFPDPPKRSRRPRIEAVEILPPRQPDRTVRLDVHHHHRSGGINPHRLVVIAAFAVLGLVLIRSPGALILIGALIPHWIWLALGVTVAVLIIANIRNHRSGRPWTRPEIRIAGRANQKATVRLRELSIVANQRIEKVVASDAHPAQLSGLLW